ncbi:hypothetical protein BHL63_13500 [Xanthomonas alfalfae]|uniref:hypothetical protein n=1 Tax=Xanthomonas euvesicatoria TaxID=456327 RepID=UPI0008D93FAC|nr:hypothetical protein BHL63_13500 [Xanthomonas alfalfae]
MDVPLMWEGFLKTSAGDDGSVDFWDGRFKNIALGPEESRKVIQKAYLPEQLPTKFIDNRMTVETLDGSSVHISHLLQFK